MKRSLILLAALLTIAGAQTATVTWSIAAPFSTPISITPPGIPVKPAVSATQVVVTGIMIRYNVNGPSFGNLQYADAEANGALVPGAQGQLRLTAAQITAIINSSAALQDVQGAIQP